MCVFELIIRHVIRCGLGVCVIVLLEKHGGIEMGDEIGEEINIQIFK